MGQQETSSSRSTQPYTDPEELVSTDEVGTRVAETSFKTPISKWAVLSVVALGVFMATLDSSIVNISLPAIARYFSVPLNGEIEWVIIAYLVVTAGILLTAGRMADLFGRKIIWLSGIIVFTTSSALCGLAPNPGILIAARAIQGAGGAMMMAVAPAMLVSAFPANERGRALGINAINVSLGISVGPVLGGFITTYLSWGWIFFINVPVGIVAIIVSTRVLKEQRRLSHGRFDPLGAILLGAGLAGITAALSFGQELGWGSPLILTPLILGVLLMTALPIVELRVPNPIIEFSLLRNRVFVSSVFSLVLSFLALSAVGFMMPFYLEDLRGFSPQLSGLLLTPLPLMFAFISPFSGSLADRIGSRWLAAGGLTLACLGLVFISQLNAQSSIFDIIWRLVVTGVGQAIFQTPNNSALMGAAPREQQGSASGFLATARTVGISMSVAISGAVFAALGGAQASHELTLQPSSSALAALQQTFTTGFQATFLICAAIAATGIITSLVRGKEVRRGAKA